MNINIMQELQKHKIISIVRGVPEELADNTAEALLEGGIRFIEVALNNEGAINIIKRWTERFSDRLLIGAGTVIDVTLAKQAVSAGARYLLSPNLDLSVLEYGLSCGVEVFPGVMTPTEIVTAYRNGASAVKVFPSGTLGIQYLKELQGPLSHIPMIPTGGVTLDNILGFINAGSHAVGIGGSLVNSEMIKAKKYDQLRELARLYTGKVISNI